MQQFTRAGDDIKKKIIFIMNVVFLRIYKKLLFKNC
jgi:hypothetical protein